MRSLGITWGLTFGLLLTGCGSGDGANLTNGSGGDNANSSASGGDPSNPDGTTNGGSSSSGTTTGSTQPPTVVSPSNPPVVQPGPPPAGAIDILVEDAPRLCESACRRQASCGEADPSCPIECVEFVLSNGGFPECADIALELLECVANVPCGQVEPRCSPLASVLLECGTLEPTPAPAPTPVPPPPVPPAPVPPPDGQVFCAVGMGSAGGAMMPGPDPNPAPITVCDSGWGDCNDGHTYRSTCVDPRGTGQLACSCIVDGIVRDSFSPGTCPLDARVVNQGCGWQLAR